MGARVEEHAEEGQREVWRRRQGGLRAAMRRDVQKEARGTV